MSVNSVGLVEWRGTIDDHTISVVPTGMEMGVGSIWASSSRDVFVSAREPDYSESFLVHYNGNRWSKMTHPFLGSFGRVFGSSSSDVYVIADGGMTLGRYDGSSWTEFYNTPSQVVYGWASGPDDIWLLGGNNQVYHYNGTSWSESTVGPVSNWHGIWGSGPDDVYACNVYDVYHYNGTSWSREYDGTDRWLGQISGSGQNHVMISSNSGRVLSYDGSTWEWQTTPGYSSMWSGISVVSPTHGLLVGQQGAVSIYDGTQWETKGVSSRRWYQMAGAGGVLYTGGISGRMMINDGGGWKAFPSSTSHNIQDLWAVHPDTLWMLSAWATGNTVRRYRGGSWQSLGTIADAWGIWAPSGDIVYVAAGPLIHRYNGSSWSQHRMVMGSMHAIWGSAQDDIWAVGRNGMMAHYNGTSWTDEGDWVDDDLFDVAGTSSSNVVAVGYHGWIQQYDGSSWTTVDTDSMSTLGHVWANAPNDIWAVGSGDIMHFGGSSWSRVRLRSVGGMECRLGAGARRVDIGRTGLFDEVKTLAINTEEIP